MHNLRAHKSRQWMWVIACTKKTWKHIWSIRVSFFPLLLFIFISRAMGFIDFYGIEYNLLNLPNRCVSSHSTKSDNGNESQMKFLVRLSHFRHATINRLFLIDIHNDKRMRSFPFLIASPSSFFFFILVRFLFIQSLATQIIVLSMIYIYLSWIPFMFSTVCAHKQDSSQCDRNTHPHTNTHATIKCICKSSVVWRI